MTINESHRAARRRAAKRFRAQVAADAGTMENNKRRRVERVLPTGGMVQYRRMTTGSRTRYASKLSRIMRSITMPYVDRFQNLTNPADSAGAYQLSYTNSDAASAVLGTSAYPVYLFELNALRYNTIGDRNSAVVSTWYSCPMSRLYRVDNTTTEHYYTDPVVGRDNDNAADTYAWSVEKLVKPTGGETVLDKAFMDWADIRIAVYGARKFPCRVRVQLVQFLDDRVQPATFRTGAIGTKPTASSRMTADPGSATATASDALDEWNAYWAQFCAPLVSHPLQSRARTVKKTLRVLKEKAYLFQPRDTSDDGPVGGVGDTVCLKWFNRVNKLYNYTQTGDQTDPAPDEENGPNEWGIENSDTLDVHARPRARLFLIISAWCTAAGSFLAEGPDNNPSFDILVRRKFTFSEV